MALQQAPNYNLQGKQDRNKRFAEEFKQGMEKGTEHLSNYYKEKEAKENQVKALQEAGLSENFASLPPEVQKYLAAQKFSPQKEDPNITAENKFQRDLALMQQKYDLERRNQADLLSGKSTQEETKKNIENQQNLAPFQAGLQTINDMRELGKKGNLGRGSSIMGLFGGETAKDRGQYEQLGKSLISLASTIPIRNQKEFETLSAKLFDPSIMDDEREGILDAMENIIQRNMQQYLPQNEQQPGQQQTHQAPKQTKRPPLKSFHR